MRGKSTNFTQLNEEKDHAFVNSKKNQRIFSGEQTTKPGPTATLNKATNHLNT